MRADAALEGFSSDGESPSFYALFCLRLLPAAGHFGYIKLIEPDGFFLCSTAVTTNKNRTANIFFS